MEATKVFDETNKLGDEIRKTNELLASLYLKHEKIKKTCDHEIVFKYLDKYPRKMEVDGNYFCPACGKTLRCFCKELMSETSFANSRIIPLTNLSLFGTKEVYQTIRNEVYNNMDLYYNPNISIEELSLRMENLLKDYQFVYESSDKVLRKETRK